MLDLNKLDKYAYAGHAVLMVKRTNDWQNVDDVLLRYAKHLRSAMKKYRQYIEKAIDMGQRTELTGGGLVRSIGGWSAVKALRKAKTLMKGDERILGDSDFVQAVLKQNEQAYERRQSLKAKGLDLNAIAQRVSQLLDMPLDQVWKG